MHISARYYCPIVGTRVLLYKTPIVLCFSNKAAGNTREKQPNLHIIHWIATSTTKRFTKQMDHCRLLILCPLHN